MAVGVVGRIVYLTVTTPVIRAAVIPLNAVVMIVMFMVLTASRWSLMLSSVQMFVTSCVKNCAEIKMQFPTHNLSEEGGGIIV